jgi:cell division protein FtsQ
METLSMIKTRVLNIILWASGIIGAIVLLSFAEQQGQEVTCTDLVVTIEDGAETPFLTEAQVAATVKQVYPQLLQTRMSEINTRLLEEQLDQLGPVQKAEVFSKLDGRLWVSITQRKPIARIMLANKNYYIDEAGLPMALSGTYSANVVLVSGSDLEQSQSEVVELVNLIQSHKDLKDVIGGIERRGNGEYVLYPTIGQHKVLLGRLQHAAPRLKKLSVFYAHGMEASWDQEIAWINLKYKDQVIIKKKGYGN